MYFVQKLKEATNHKKKDADSENARKDKSVCVGTRITSLGFEVSEAQPLLFEGGILRPYQLEGLEWTKNYIVRIVIYLKI